MVRTAAATQRAPRVYRLTRRHPREDLMRHVFAASFAVLVMLVLTAGAGAITYGVPDGNGHPEVGALLAQQAFSDGTWEECSGTLIARSEERRVGKECR